MYTAIERVRSEKKNVLLLDAGDQFTGTMWFEQYKGLASATFMNLMKYDAMTLGNHEFDLGPSALHPYINALHFPVVSSNVDFTKQPGWPVREKFHLKSTVVKYGNISVGIIGFTTPDTVWLSSPGPNVTFQPIVASIQREVRRLKQEQGIKIFIGLGHAGFRTDVDVLKKIPELDVVVGGHSNTFLYTGKPPDDKDKPKGVYPHVVVQNGKKQLAVQAYAYGKYLGKLHVKFDMKGDVKSWSGNPVLLGDGVARDSNILRKVKRMSLSVKSQSEQIVGYSNVPLRRRPCSVRDCPLGNMITDAIASNIDATDLVLINSGAIRASIVKQSAKDGITFGELYKVHPFGNSIDVVGLRGRVLKQAFENSVSALPQYRLGRFLQVSGIRVEYNISKPVGERVKSIQVRGPATLEYREIDDEKLYTVAVSNYLIAGGDGFFMLKNHESRVFGEKLITLVKRFMSVNRTLKPKADGRIRLVGFSTL